MIKFLGKIPFLAYATAFASLIAVYAKVFFAPNSYLFGAWGDGIKNYFSFLFSAQHDTSWWYTKSMNYPYSELLLYTDAQPLLSWSFRILCDVFPALSDYGVAYMNLAMLLSLVFAYVLTYLVLKRLGIRSWFAYLFALGIMALQPQIFRMAGHYGLSYAFVIPLAIYLVLSFQNRWNIARALLEGLCNFLIFFLHPYLGLIFSVSIIFFALPNAALSFQWKKLYPLLGSFLAIGLFMLLTKLGDPHEGRTPDPFGFLMYRAQLKTVLLPHHPPLKPLVQSFIKIGGQQWEGWAYLGLSCVLMIFIMSFRGILKLGRSLRRITSVSSLLFITGLLSLLFSLAIPFTLGLEELIPYLGPLKQFRSLGRFAWIAFFAFNFVVAFKLYAWYRLYRKRTQWAILIVLVPCAFMLFEAWPYHQEVSSGISRGGNAFLAEDNNFSSSEYMAILPIPAQVHGSENFELPGDEETNAKSFLISYKTGIPVLGGSSGRTSIHEAHKQVQAMGPEFYPKLLKEEFPDGKLLLVRRNNWQMNRYERNLWSKADQLESKGIWDFAEIAASDFLSYNPKEIPADSSYSKPIYFDDFDKLESDYVMSGTGAISGSKRQYLRIAQFDSSLKPGNYVLNVWVYTKGYSMPQQNVLLEVKYKGEEGLPRIASVSPGNSVVILEDWSMLEIPFAIDREIEVANLVAKGSRLSTQKAYFDNLMLRKEGTNAGLWINEQQMLWNGFLLSAN